MPLWIFRLKASAVTGETDYLDTCWRLKHYLCLTLRSSNKQVINTEVKLWANDRLRSVLSDLRNSTGKYRVVKHYFFDGKVNLFYQLEQQKKLDDFSTLSSSAEYESTVILVLMHKILARFPLKWKMKDITRLFTGAAQVFWKLDCEPWCQVYLLSKLIRNYTPPFFFPGVKRKRSLFLNILPFSIKMHIIFFLY